MKIAINLIPFSSVSGIEIFAKNLLTHLIKVANEQKRIKVVILRGKDSPQFLSFPGAEVITVPAKGKIQKAVYQQTEIYALLKKIKADILFAPSPAAPFFYKNKIVVIHDCAYDRFKEFDSLLTKLYFKTMFWGAKYFSQKIITVSQFSKKELVKLYKIRPNKITVISEGVPKLTKADNKFIRKTLRKFNLDNIPYFLYIGNTRPRKNILGLLKAFSIFSKKYPLYKLILAGKIDTRFLDVKKIIKQLNLEGRVVQIGPIYEKEKTALLKSAQALAFPTFYEGFGLPVLESQKLGVPVLTSNTSSLPEVAGKGALFVDPYNLESIAYGMEAIAFDNKLRQELIKKGLENIQRFSWENAAQKLLSVFQKVI